MSRSVIAATRRTALPARSTVLSLMLGAHPGRMAAAELVRAGALFGISESTLRVALTRAVAAGDLVRAADGYALGDRLVERQQRQDESVRHASEPWDGRWDQVVVVEAGRAAADRAALRSALIRAHLAELREGVWMRPANRPDRVVPNGGAVARFTVAPVDDAVGLAADLWDLDTWALDGRALVEELATTREPAMRLAVAADLVRHLLDDPLLPGELLPADWPGDSLRSAYAAYQDELVAAWA